MKDSTRRTVGIFVFPDVEVLDFAGPFEVFSRTRTEPGPASRQTEESAPFVVFTVGVEQGSLMATGGLEVGARESFSSAPPIDVLVIPGGFGTRPLIGEPATMDWIRKVAASAELVTSVCTGSILLAEAGLLAGRRATTHHGELGLLREYELDADRRLDVQTDVRVVDDGVISSAGVSAGIDMAFYVVAKLCGEAIARETAEYIEYPYPERPLERS